MAFPAAIVVLPLGVLFFFSGLVVNLIQVCVVFENVRTKFGFAALIF